MEQDAEVWLSSSLPQRHNSSSLSYPQHRNFTSAKEIGRSECGLATQYKEKIHVRVGGATVQQWLCSCTYVFKFALWLISATVGIFSLLHRYHSYSSLRQCDKERANICLVERQEVYVTCYLRSQGWALTVISQNQADIYGLYSNLVPSCWPSGSEALSPGPHNPRLLIPMADLIQLRPPIS